MDKSVNKETFSNVTLKFTNSFDTNDGSGCVNKLTFIIMYTDSFLEKSLTTYS